jgi:hypothetical protein
LLLLLLLLLLRHTHDNHSSNSISSNPNRHLAELNGSGRGIRLEMEGSLRHKANCTTPRLQVLRLLHHNCRLHVQLLLMLLLLLLLLLMRLLLLLS